MGLKLGTTMLIHNKDDIKFVTELIPCFLGHPVLINNLVWYIFHLFTLNKHYKMETFFGQNCKVRLIKIRYFATVRTRKLWYACGYCVQWGYNWILLKNWNKNARKLDYSAQFLCVYCAQFRCVYCAQFRCVYCAQFRCVYCAQFRCVYCAQFRCVYCAQLNSLALKGSQLRK